MKTIEQLEEEAKQARQAAITIYETDTSTMSQKVDAVILASTAMVTYQFALGMQEVIDCVPGDSDSCDGWIEWKGGYCPVNDANQLLEVKYRSTQIYNRVAEAWRHRWHHADRSWVIDGSPELDIIAYRIVK